LLDVLLDFRIELRAHGRSRSGHSAEIGTPPSPLDARARGRIPLTRDSDTPAG
jgi:hypothetical protein